MSRHVKHIRWTPQDDELVSILAPSLKSAEIAVRLGRSHGSVARGIIMTLYSLLSIRRRRQIDLLFA